MGPPPVPIVSAKKWDIQIEGRCIEVCDKNGQLVVKRVAPQVAQSERKCTCAGRHHHHAHQLSSGMTSMAFCAVVSQQLPPIRIGFERK